MSDTLKYIGKCRKCHTRVYLDDKAPTSEGSNVGDYDFVCYPCQLEMMDKGEWQEWKYRQLAS